MKKLIFIHIIILLIIHAGISYSQGQPWWNSWVKYPTNQPVLEGIAGTWYETVSSPNVIYEDGKFKMWFRGIDGIENEYGAYDQQIGYAWSHNGLNWNVKNEPVIQKTDEIWIKAPGTVQRINDTLRMWYWTFYGTTMQCDIRYAWSLDDTTWHESEEPALENGEPGTWNEYYPFLGYVFYDTSLYHMYFTSGETILHGDEIGHATSTDGIHWEKDTANPVLRLGPNGSFYDYRILSGQVVFHEDTLHMFFGGYDIHDGSQHPMTGHAYSVDAPNWSEWFVSNNDLPVLEVGEEGSWDEKYALVPGVLLHDNIYHMWYDGRNNNYDGNIGYAKQSVTCLPEGILFTTQSQIDSFSINNKYCNNIQGDVIISGEDIVNLDSLVFLTGVEGDLVLQDNGSLTDVTGLINITSVGGNLVISNNNQLSDLTGLENLGSITGNLTIIGNTVLEICRIENICSYLETPSGIITITDNASGCNSIVEVEVACGFVGVHQTNAENIIKIYPNPATDQLIIEFPKNNSVQNHIEVSTLTGKVIYTEVSEDTEHTFNLSDLPEGLYLIRISNKNLTQIEKVIKVK